MAKSAVPVAATRAGVSHATIHYKPNLHSFVSKLPTALFFKLSLECVCHKNAFRLCDIQKRFIFFQNTHLYPATLTLTKDASVSHISRNIQRRFIRLISMRKIYSSTSVVTCFIFLGSVLKEQSCRAKTDSVYKNNINKSLNRLYFLTAK